MHHLRLPCPQKAKTARSETSPHQVAQQIFKTSGMIIETRNITQSAKGEKKVSGQQ
jgi:hypothetical protein